MCNTAAAVPEVVSHHPFSASILHHGTEFCKSLICLYIHVSMLGGLKVPSTRRAQSNMYDTAGLSPGNKIKLQMVNTCMDYRISGVAQADSPKQH
jgi:hypothetical protein